MNELSADARHVEHPEAHCDEKVEGATIMLPSGDVIVSSEDTPPGAVASGDDSQGAEWTAEVAASLTPVEENVNECNSTGLRSEAMPWLEWLSARVLEVDPDATMAVTARSGGFPVIWSVEMGGKQLHDLGCLDRHDKVEEMLGLCMLLCQGKKYC